MSAEVFDARHELFVAVANCLSSFHYNYVHPENQFGDASEEYAEEGLDAAVDRYVAARDGQSLQILADSRLDERRAAEAERDRLGELGDELADAGGALLAYAYRELDSPMDALSARLWQAVKTWRSAR